MSTTLLELRTRSRQLADMVDNEFVSDSELNNYINFAIAELHDLLVAAYGSDYFLSSTTGTTTSGTQDYSLPSDFYKLRGVDVKINNSDWFNVKPFNFNERNRFDDSTSWTYLGLSNLRYRIMGSNLKFTPTPDNAQQYRIWYVPVATKLSDDADTLDDVNQYSDYIIVSAALKMAHKQEMDTSSLAAERARLERRITEMAPNRDAAQPESISDIYAEDVDHYWNTSNN